MSAPCTGSRLPTEVKLGCQVSCLAASSDTVAMSFWFLKPWIMKYMRVPNTAPTMRMTTNNSPPAMRKRLSIGITSVSGCSLGGLATRPGFGCRYGHSAAFTQAAAVGADIFAGGPHDGLAEAADELGAAGGRSRFGMQVLVRPYLLELVLDVLEVLVEDRLEPRGREEMGEIHEHQEFGLDLVLRHRVLEAREERFAACLGEVVDLAVRSALARGGARGHQLLAGEFRERGIDGAVPRQEAMAEGALEELLDVVAGGVPVGEGAQAQVFDVHRGSLMDDRQTQGRPSYIGLIYGTSDDCHIPL